MTQSIENTVTENTATVETVAAVVPTPVVVVPKAPSLKSRAVAIFAAKMVERSQGLFATNKDFRAAVLRAVETELGVSTASAATMYNSCKKDAETADTTVVLGRDPRKEKPVSTGVRGRPVGSKNKTKEEVAVVVPTDSALVVNEVSTVPDSTLIVDDVAVDASTESVDATI